MFCDAKLDKIFKFQNNFLQFRRCSYSNYNDGKSQSLMRYVKAAIKYLYKPFAFSQRIPIRGQGFIRTSVAARVPRPRRDATDGVISLILLAIP